jgi:hypothetical protein
MEERMSLVLFALVLWLLASVPFALFFAAVCRLSEWPFDADTEHIARKTAQRLAKSRAPRRRAGRDSRAADMMPA